MKILILGGNGLLGQTLFFYLNKKTDHNIYATVRNKKYINKFVSEKFKKKYLSNIDLSNSIKIEEVISKTNPDDPTIYDRTQVSDLWILSDPENPNVPSNFELIYKSTQSQFVVYKIHHGK